MTTTRNDDYVPMPSLEETLACAQKDVGWDPMDMIGHPLSTEDNASACLRRCRMVTGCAHFAFYAPFSHCHIADAFATPQPARLGFISAPAGCVSGSGGHRSTVSTMLLQKHCFKNGVSYAPYFIAGEELEGPHPVLVKDVLECQRRCAEKSPPDGKQANDFPACQRFQYNVFTTVCHMMTTVPKGAQVSADYLISGPPRCPGRIQFNLTVENVDLEKLDQNPDLKHLLEEMVLNETLRDPPSYVEVGERPSVTITNGSNRIHFHEFCTTQVKEIKLYPLNASILLEVDVPAKMGISFGTAKLRDTHRCQIGERVDSGLKQIQSSIAPVLHPGSDVYVSGVSPIAAVDHNNTRFQSAVAMDRSVQGIWMKLSGGRSVVATSCLLVTLVLCVSMSAASWRRTDRSRRRLAIRPGYEPLWEMPASHDYHEPREGYEQSYRSQEPPQHDSFALGHSHQRAESSEVSNDS